MYLKHDGICERWPIAFDQVVAHLTREVFVTNDSEQECVSSKHMAEKAAALYCSH